MRVPMELDVPTHSQNVLREHLQGIDKQKEIELYYELISSGHSVGEILDSLDHLQGKSEHGNVLIAEHPSPKVDRVARDVTSEAASRGVAPADTERTPSLTAPAEAKNGGTKDSELNELGSGDREKLAGASFPGYEHKAVRPAALSTSIAGEIAIPPGNQELRRAGRFSIGAKEFAIGVLYTVAVASASIASFALISGGPNAGPTTTRVQSGISSGTEAAAIRTSAADRSQKVDEGPKPTKRVVNANSSSAPEPSRSAELHSAVPGSPPREAAEVPTAFSASTSHIAQVAEPGRQVQTSAIKNHDAVGSGSGRLNYVSVLRAKEIGGQQIVRAFYTALERGDGEAASLLVVPEKREVGPFSASELSNFYGRLELPFRLIAVHRAGEKLYDVAYTYKVRNGRFCNGRSFVRTVSLHDQVLIEKIRSPSGC